MPAYVLHRFKAVQVYSGKKLVLFSLLKLLLLIVLLNTPHTLSHLVVVGVGIDIGLEVVEQKSSQIHDMMEIVNVDKQIQHLIF